MRKSARKGKIETLRGYEIQLNSAKQNKELIIKSKIQLLPRHPSLECELFANFQFLGAD